MALAEGDLCPAISLPAAVSLRPNGPAAWAGHVAVVVVHGARSTDAAKEVAKAVRSRKMDAWDPILVSVVDLRSMSGLWRKAAEAQMRSTYDKLAKGLPAGSDAGDHIRICPDWDGTASQALGVDEPDREPAAIVVGKEGRVRGVATGAKLGDQVLALLATA
ncbi:MAG: hypothetical protein ACYDBQ_07105 [Thermoplasmatota archaeon]